MCIEEHHKYSCNDKHTLFRRVEATCPLSRVPGHQKYKMIRGTIPGPCNKCLSKGPWIMTRTPYTVPVTYVQAAPPVVYKQVPTVVVPTIKSAVQPTVIVTATAPPRAPTLPQQIPGAGSGGTPLGDPPGWIKEVKAEWMPSKGCYENVVHYKRDPAAPTTNQTAQQGGYNTIHGRDPGPPPPGWGAQPNPFPAPKKTGYNPTHGRDPGPPPPGMGGMALVPLPLQSLPITTTQTQAQSSARPSVRFADPVAKAAGVNIASTDTSDTLTETSSETSGSDTETSTSGSSTSTATI